jgi:pimeloyl-ACP methyl ester carboxylesterase
LNTTHNKEGDNNNMLQLLFNILQWFLYISIASIIILTIVVYWYEAPAKTPSQYKLHYEVFGNGPIHIVYVVGFATNWKWWSENVIHLEPADYDLSKYSIVVFDNRASGMSFTPRGFATPRLMAEDAWDLIMNELKWSKVHLIGQSMGGLIVQNMVQILNERRQKDPNWKDIELKSVNLFNTFISFYHIPYGLPLWSAIKFILLSPLHFRHRDIVRHVIHQMFSKEFVEKEYHQLEEKFKQMFHSSEMNRIGAIKQLFGLILHYNSPSNFVKQLQLLGKPVLIVCSTGDAMVAHRNSLEMYRLLEQSNPSFTITLEIIEGAGHIVNSEAKQRINDLLYKRWLLQHGNE